MKACRLSRYVLFLVLPVFLVSCTTFPLIKQIDPAATQRCIEQCRRPFLDTPHRFVHAMEAGLPNGISASLLGITLFDPRSGNIHSALLTLEGFVLLDARYEKGDVQVSRAVPPFDGPHFARNLLDDVRLMFLAPQGPLLKAGLREDGAAMCRYEGEKGRTIDVAVRENEEWEIVTYGEHEETLRRVTAATVKNGIPEKMALTGFFNMSYALGLTLISAEPVTAETVP